MPGRASLRAGAAKWHSPRVPLGVARARSQLALGATAASAGAAAESSGALPTARPHGAADRARADGHAPVVGGARIALGASLVDRARCRPRGSRCSPAGASPTTPPTRSRPGSARAGRGSCRCSPIRSTWPASCSPTARCGGGWPCAWASRCARSARAASCSTGATCRLRRARAMRPSCTSCASSSGRARRSSSRCRRCARSARCARGAYDLRALARPARLLVLAWNEHGPRSEPGPGGLARVLEADAAHGAARRAALARADGRADLGLALERRGGRGRRAGDPGAALPRGHRDRRCSAPTARAWASDAWVESDRSVQLKLLVARQARIAGVALWVRGGRVLRHLASAAPGVPAAAPRGSRARPRTP